MKCISLDPQGLQRMHEESDWYCPICLTGLFPFNHIKDGDIFIAEINKIEICPEIINISVGMLFNPFEVNEDQYYTPLYELIRASNIITLSIPTWELIVIIITKIILKQLSRPKVLI